MIEMVQRYYTSERYPAFLGASVVPSPYKAAINGGYNKNAFVLSGCIGVLLVLISLILWEESATDSIARGMGCTLLIAGHCRRR